jgi:hypothetical protein
MISALLQGVAHAPFKGMSPSPFPLKRRPNRKVRRRSFSAFGGMNFMNLPAAEALS